MRRTRGFNLAALFTVMAVCAVVWSFVRLIGGQSLAFTFSFVGLGFFGFCMLSVASGHVGFRSKITLSIGVFWISLALLAALIE